MAFGRTEEKTERVLPHKSLAERRYTMDFGMHPELKPEMPAFAMRKPRIIESNMSIPIPGMSDTREVIPLYSCGHCGDRVFMAKEPAVERNLCSPCFDGKIRRLGMDGIGR